MSSKRCNQKLVQLIRDLENHRFEVCILDKSERLKGLKNKYCEEARNGYPDILVRAIFRLHKRSRCALIEAKLCISKGEIRNLERGARKAIEQLNRVLGDLIHCKRFIAFPSFEKYKRSSCFSLRKSLNRGLPNNIHVLFLSNRLESKVVDCIRDP